MAPILLALGAAAGFATSGIFVRFGSQGIKPSTGTAISLIPSFFLALIPALILDLPVFLDIPMIGIFWIAFLATLNFPLGRLLNYTTIGRIGAARAAPLFSSAPLFSAILAIAVLGERPNPVILLGTIVVVLGTILIVQEGRRYRS